MSAHIQEQAILLALEPLFGEAEEKGLWFYHVAEGEDEVWCSPQYLKKKQQEGELIWGPEHWQLRNPKGYLRALRRKAMSAAMEYNELASRMGEKTKVEVREVLH